MDAYTKLILTIIAIALTIIALNPWIAPKRAQADYSQPIPVYIVDGPYNTFNWANIEGGALRVKVREY